MKTIAYCVLWALAIFMVAGGSATAQDLAKIVTKADVEKVTGAKFKDGWKPMPTQMSFGQEGGDLQISVDVEPREVSSTVRGWEATIKKMQPSNSVETVPGVGKDAIYYSMRPDTAQFPPTSTVRVCNCASRSRAPRPPRKRSRSSSISRRSSGRASASSFPPSSRCGPASPNAEPERPYLVISETTTGSTPGPVHVARRPFRWCERQDRIGRFRSFGHFVPRLRICRMSPSSRLS